MIIAKKVRELPSGFVIKNYCDNCNEFMAFNRASDCKWILDQNGDNVIACCCSMKCAKALMAKLEDEK